MMAKLLPFVLGLGLVISSPAADTKPTSAKVAAGPVTASKAPKRYPYHANVAAIDTTKSTITLVGKKKQRVLNITPTTRILKDKKPVALETIKVGEYITGSLVDTDGRLEPTTVNVGGTGTKQVAQVASPTATQTAVNQKRTGSVRATTLGTKKN
jgi:hypothetical protein